MDLDHGRTGMGPFLPKDRHSAFGGVVGRTAALDVRLVMRHVGTTVTIITTHDGRQSYGMVATAMMSLSMEPPALAIGINHSASIHKPLLERRAFCVNILSRHDEDISREDILKKGIVSEADYKKLEEYTLALYKKGTELAAERGLILVDTKYEFGKHNGVIYLIDEVHTPDSSRYFYAEGYEARQKAGEAQKQLSKEFVRQWLIENGFQGKDGQTVPEMTDPIVASISARYKELYEHVRGASLPAVDYDRLTQRIEQSILNSINSANLQAKKN